MTDSLPQALSYCGSNESSINKKTAILGLPDIIEYIGGNWYSLANAVKVQNHSIATFHPYYMKVYYSVDLGDNTYTIHDGVGEYIVIIETDEMNITTTTPSDPDIYGQTTQNIHLPNTLPYGRAYYDGGWAESQYEMSSKNSEDNSPCFSSLMPNFHNLGYWRLDQNITFNNNFSINIFGTGFTTGSGTKIIWDIGDNTLSDNIRLVTVDKVPHFRLYKSGVLVADVSFESELIDSLLENGDIWHMFTVTYNSSTKLAKVYLDGLLIASANSLQSISTSSRQYLYLGAITGTTQQGYYESLITFDQELSADNILKFYKCYTLGKPFIY